MQDRYHLRHLRHLDAAGLPRSDDRAYAEREEDQRRGDASVALGVNQSESHGCRQGQDHACLASHDAHWGGFLLGQSGKGKNEQDGRHEVDGLG